jgi:hypothetical protein
VEPVTKDEMAYAAFKDCGCLVAAIMKRCPRSDVAKEIASWARSGYRIEHLTVETVREASWDCPHKAKASDQLTLDA